jgi:uncharacterized protein YcfJ
MTELLAFVGVAVVVIVTPGQDTALTVRNTLSGGRGAGVRTAAGVVRGSLSGAQIRRSCCSGVFVDQTAESIASVKPVWRVRTDEP